MPGYNQRGPENMGPMTGRGMGRCMTGSDRDPVRTGRAYGAGNGRGRRCGRGFARGAAPWSGAPAQVTREDLTLRARALEKELEAVNQELKSYSGE
ncbi:DUF5320 domain-containing protein [Desulfospira joergensenii]|uniref:DUF5320 domain-containing protein n=1 Tax=Desulfospira joergensenii TaxID=53329 RepID=UPI0003B43EAF|nr:DUF5320 domain-containing protein [Desulfospira joergensenii]